MKVAIITFVLAIVLPALAAPAPEPQNLGLTCKTDADCNLGFVCMPVPFTTVMGCQPPMAA
ncbi:MAG: hypothetical protein M1816_007105 [Peltula sp. TS41687]|nr:MAG: hypothetical protein M1816_007105 [Peltula sp. TS41687]